MATPGQSCKHLSSPHLFQWGTELARPPSNPCQPRTPAFSQAFLTGETVVFVHLTQGNGFLLISSLEPGYCSVTLALVARKARRAGERPPRVPCNRATKASKENKQRNQAQKSNLELC